MEPRIALSGVDAIEIYDAPPAPSWAVAPYATSPTSISMSVTAVDVGGTAEYYFTCTTDTSQNSGWQSSTTFVAWNLAPETAYSFTAKVRKKDVGPESPDSTTASASTPALPADAMAKMTAAVTNIVNQIRAVETFTNPNNPGQITAQLRKDNYPDPTAPNTPYPGTPPTKGLAVYPTDGRNTPGAFQVDLANMTVQTAGTTPATTDYYERFGEWKGNPGGLKNSTAYDTQIAFSKQTLHDYFGIDVDANGLITKITAPAASVFLHDDSLAGASSSVWDPENNPLIGMHIDGFQKEQLSLYLAGREAADPAVNIASTRSCPESVMAMSEALQNQVSKDYSWGTYREGYSNWLYGVNYRNSMNLFGAKLEITSTVDANIFGINKNEVFWCRFNPAFVMGGAYVSGIGAMNGFLEKLLEADSNGSAVWNAGGKNINIVKKQDGASAADKIFTIDQTPENVGAQYPTILHYAAVLSPYGVADEASSYWVSVADVYADAWGYTGRNVTAGLGYTRLTEQAVSGTTTKNEGGVYVYSNLVSGGTLTLTGSGNFIVRAPTTATITADGFTVASNQGGRVGKGMLIDISSFVQRTESQITNNQDILNSSFYQWWDSTEHWARVNDPTVPTGRELNFYFIPAAKEGGTTYIAEHKGEFWDPSKPIFYSARIGVENVDVLGRGSTADVWAQNFITYSSGAGVIDASQTTGNVLIIADKSIQKILLGTGKTTVLTDAGNTAQKTFVLNANATIAPTIDLRTREISGKKIPDIIDWSRLSQELVWSGGTALTYDSQTTSFPYLRYSSYADWTGTHGTETKTFHAIVHAGGNTGADDPALIVEKALKPTKVTIDRTSQQASRTSASLLNFIVVFSEKVTEFDGTDVTLSGPTATIDGADIVVTNPSGDQMTFSVAVTLKDTAATGVVTATISAGAAEDEEGYGNLASTSTDDDNTVSYVPNTITGRETSGSEPLPGVLISIKSSTVGFTPRTTTTDSDGYYRFVVPDGAYQVTMTPPNACINSGSETTIVTAASSQTFEADFTVGALKPGCIPNRMMVTSSLPVGSVQWRQVVQEALNLGGQAAGQNVQVSVAKPSQPAVVQYLTLAPAPQIVSIASPAPVADVKNTIPVNVAGVQAGSQPGQITEQAIGPIVEEAITRWAAAGADHTTLEKMRNATFVVTDLAGLYLGMTNGNTVWLDGNAAGRGWFADLTPNDDDEFDSLVAGSSLRAVDPQALDRIDLLTVVSHELGHVAGLSDSDISDLMRPTLQNGLRLIPSALDAALASV